jgi:rhamnose transport system permease protein
MSTPARPLLSRLLANRDTGLAVLTLLLGIVLAARYQPFRDPASLAAFFDDTAILILLALGQMLVIITRGIDLSVAANVAFSGMAVALLNHAYPALPVALLMLLAVLIGLALGLVNGLLVWRLDIPPIVATLGTMAIYRGSVYLMSGGVWVTSDKMTPAFQSLMRHSVLGLTLLSWLALLAVGTLAWWLHFARAGRRVYMAGGNPAAAACLGVSAGRMQCLAFVISGGIAGLCGYLWVTRYAVAYTDVAQGFELSVIAACVIGGVSVAGGIGTVTGALLGCLFLGLIRNALPLAGVSPFWQMAVSGLVITVAVVLNARRSASRRRHILEAEAT